MIDLLELHESLKCCQNQWHIYLSGVYGWTTDSSLITYQENIPHGESFRLWMLSTLIISGYPIEAMQ